MRLLLAALLISVAMAQTPAPTVTIQITISQDEYNAIAETLADQLRMATSYEPVDCSNPHAQKVPVGQAGVGCIQPRVANVPKYATVEEMIADLLAKNLQGVLLQHPNAKTKAARDAADAQAQAARDAAKVNSLTVQKK